MNERLSSSTRTAQASVSESARRIVEDYRSVSAAAIAMGVDADLNNKKVESSFRSMATSIGDAAKRMGVDLGIAKQSQKDFSDQATQTGLSVSDAATVSSGSVSAMAGSVSADLDKVNKSQKDVAEQAQKSSVSVTDANGRMHDSYGRFVSKVEEARRKNEEFVASNKGAAESNNSVIGKLKERITFTLSLSKEEGGLSDKTRLLSEANKRLASSAGEAAVGERSEASATRDLASAQDRLNAARASAMTSSTFISNLRNEAEALKSTTAAVNSATSSQVASMEILKGEAKKMESSYAAVAASARSSAYEQRQAMSGLAEMHSLEAHRIIEENDKIIASNEKVAISRVAAREGVTEKEAAREMSLASVVSSVIPGPYGKAAAIGVASAELARNVMNNPTVQDFTEQKRALQTLTTEEEQHFEKAMEHYRGIDGEKQRAIALEHDLEAATKRRMDLDLKALQDRNLASRSGENAPTRNFGILNPIVNWMTGGQGIVQKGWADQIKHAQENAEASKKAFEQASADEQSLQSVKNSGHIKLLSDIQSEENAAKKAHAHLMSDLEEEKKKRSEVFQASSTSALSAARMATLSPVPGGGLLGLAAGPLLPAAGAGLVLGAGAALPALAFGGAAAAGLGAGVLSMPGLEATNQLQVQGLSGDTKGKNGKVIQGDATKLSNKITEWASKYGTDSTLAKQAAAGLLNSGVPLNQIEAIMQPGMQATGVSRGASADAAQVGLSVFGAYKPQSTASMKKLMNMVYAGTGGDFKTSAAQMPALLQTASEMHVGLPAVMAAVERTTQTGKPDAQSMSAVGGLMTSIFQGSTNTLQMNAAKALHIDPKTIFGENIGAMGGLSTVVSRMVEGAKNNVGSVDQLMARNPNLSRRQATAEQLKLVSSDKNLMALVGGRANMNEALILGEQNGSRTTLAQETASLKATSGGSIQRAADIHDKSPMAQFDKAKNDLKGKMEEIGAMFIPVITMALKELDKLGGWVAAHKSMFGPIAKELTSLGADFQKFATWVSTGTRLSALKAFWQEILTLKKHVGDFLGGMGTEFGKLGKPFQAAISDLKSGFSAFKGDAKGGQDTAKTFSDILVGVIRFAAGIWDVEMHVIAGAIKIVENIAGAFKKLTDAVGLTSGKAKDGNSSMIDFSGTMGKATGIAIALYGAYKILEVTMAAGKIAVAAYRAVFVTLAVEQEGVMNITRAQAIADKAGAVAKGIASAAIWVWNGGLWASVAALDASAIAARLATIAMDALPFVAIGLLIVALVAGLIYMYNHWTGFRNVVNWVASEVLKLVQGLSSGVVQLFKDISSFLITVGKDIISAILWPWQHIYDFLVGHSLIPDLINGIINWFKKLPGEVMGFISDLAKKLWAEISSWPGKVAGFFGTIASNIAKWFKDRAVDMVKGAKDLIVSMATGIKDKAGAIKDALFNGVKEAFDNIKNNLGSLVGGAFGGIGDFIKGILNGGSGTSGGGGPDLFTNRKTQTQALLGPERTTGEGFGFKAVGHDDYQYAANTALSLPRLPTGDSYHIKFAGWDKAGGGNTIVAQIVDGGGTVVGMFDMMHLNKIDPGITAGGGAIGGQKAGLSGNTGHSTGAHLHFAYDKGAQQALNTAGYYPYTGFAEYSAHKYGTTGNGISTAGAGGGISSAVKRWGPQIDSIASKYGIPPMVLASLIQQESQGNQGAISSTGAIGLTQLEPGTARQMGVDPYSASGNIEGGAKYLRSLLNSTHGNMRMALEGYNAGGGHSQAYYESVRNGANGPTSAQYADQILRRIPAGRMGGSGGQGGGGPSMGVDPVFASTHRYIQPTMEGNSSIAGRWVEKTEWQKTHVWVDGSQITNSHGTGMTPGHWASTPAPPYDLSIGKYSAVNALAATSPTHRAYNTDAQGLQGWKDMGSTQIPALAQSIKSLAPEVQKSMKPVIDGLAQKWSDIGTKANTARSEAYAKYHAKVGVDDAAFAHKMSDVYQGAAIKQTASHDTYILAQKKLMDNQANHAATATEANRHALANFNLKQNENNTNYLSQQAKLVYNGGESSRQAEANLAKTYGIHTKAAAALLNESLTHQGQNQAIYSAKQKQTFDNLATSMGIHNSTQKSTLAKHIADLQYTNSSKTAGDLAAYHKQLAAINKTALAAENSLQAAIVAERAKIAAASTPEAMYKAAGVTLNNIVTRQTAIGSSLEWAGKSSDGKGNTLDGAISAVAKAMDGLDKRAEAAARFSDAVAAQRHDVAGVESGINRRMSAQTGRGVGALVYGDTGGVLEKSIAGVADKMQRLEDIATKRADFEMAVAQKRHDVAGVEAGLNKQITSQTAKGVGALVYGDTGGALATSVSGVAEKMLKLQDIAQKRIDFELDVAIKMGDFPKILTNLQAKISKVSGEDLAKLGVAALTGTGDLVSLTQAVIADEAAVKKKTIAEDSARLTADAANGTFSALSGDLGKISPVINDALFNELMKGKGINEEYMNGMIRMREVQLTMTQTTEGVNAVIAATTGDIGGMASSVTALTNVSLARWQQAMRNGEGVQNQYSAELVKEAGVLRTIQVAQLANDYALGQMTGDVSKVSSALQGFQQMANNAISLMTTNTGRLDDIIPKAGEGILALGAKAQAAALNLGTLDDIISGLSGNKDSLRKQAEKEYATTGNISPETLSAYKAAGGALTGATWTQVGADLKLSKSTGDIIGYNKTLGDEIGLQTSRLANLGVMTGIDSKEYKDQALILENMKKQQAGLSFQIDKSTIKTADDQSLATWALDQFKNDGVSPAEDALKGMTVIITQSAIDVAKANELAATATLDLGKQAASAAIGLNNMIAPLATLVNKINGMNTVNAGPVTVNGSPVNVTGSVAGNTGGTPTGNTDSSPAYPNQGSNPIGFGSGQGGDSFPTQNYSPPPAGIGNGSGQGGDAFSAPPSGIGFGSGQGGDMFPNGSGQGGDAFSIIAPPTSPPPMTGEQRRQYLNLIANDVSPADATSIVTGYTAPISSAAGRQVSAAEANAQFGPPVGIQVPADVANAQFGPPPGIQVPADVANAQFRPAPTGAGMYPIVTPGGGVVAPGGTISGGGNLGGSPGLSTPPPALSGDGGPMGVPMPSGGGGGGGGGTAPSSTPSSVPSASPSPTSSGYSGPMPVGDPRGPAAVLAQAHALVAFTSLMDKNAGPAQLKASAEALQASTNIDAAAKIMMQVGVEGGKNQKQMIDAARVQIQAEMDVIQANYANAGSMMSAAGTFNQGAQTFTTAVSAFGAATQASAAAAAAAKTSTSVTRGPSGSGFGVGSGVDIGPNANKKIYDDTFASLVQGMGGMDYVISQNPRVLKGIEAQALTAAMVDYYGNQMLLTAQLNPWDRNADGTLRPTGYQIDPQAAAQSFADKTVFGVGTNAIVDSRNNGNGYIVNTDINGSPVIPGLSMEQAGIQVAAGLRVNANSYYNQMTGSVGIGAAADPSKQNWDNGLVHQNYLAWLANGGPEREGSGYGNFNPGSGQSVMTREGVWSFLPKIGDKVGSTFNATFKVDPVTGLATVYDDKGNVVPISKMYGYTESVIPYAQNDMNIGGDGYQQTLFNQAGWFQSGAAPATPAQVAQSQGFSAPAPSYAYNPRGVSAAQGGAIIGTTSGYVNQVGVGIGGSFGAQASPYGGAIGGMFGNGMGTSSNAFGVPVGAGIGGKAAGAGFDTGFGGVTSGTGGTYTGGTTSASGYQSDPMYIKLKAMLDALTAIQSNTGQTADNTAVLADIKSWMRELWELEQANSSRQIGQSTDFRSWFDNLGIAGVGMLSGGAT